MIRVLADTGAIIALLDEDDKHHAAFASILFNIIRPEGIDYLELLP